MVEATERCSLAAASFSSCLMSADVRIDTVSSFSRLIVTLRKPFCAANVRQLPYAKIVPGDRRGPDWRHGFRRRQRSSWVWIEKACAARASRRFQSLFLFSGYALGYTEPSKTRGTQINVSDARASQRLRSDTCGGPTHAAPYWPLVSLAYKQDRGQVLKTLNQIDTASS